MNTKQRKTLRAILSNPMPKSLVFRDVESMLEGIGCTVIEGEGSRVTFFFNGERWHTHRPHPGKEIWSYQIRSIRIFLEKIGIRQ